MDKQTNTTFIIINKLSVAHFLPQSQPSMLGEIGGMFTGYVYWFIVVTLQVVPGSVEGI